MSGRVNGTPQPSNKVPRKKVDSGGGKKGGGCFAALVLFGLLSTGWLHMIATSAGWSS